MQYLCITVPSITTFASGSYIGGHADCCAGGLSKLRLKWVTDLCKRLNISFEGMSLYRLFISSDITFILFVAFILLIFCAI